MTYLNITKQTSKEILSNVQPFYHLGPLLKSILGLRSTFRTFYKTRHLSPRFTVHLPPQIDSMLNSLYRQNQKSCHISTHNQQSSAG